VTGRGILLDCDPGNDDALGILVAAGHPALELRAVTTGAGPPLGRAHGRAMPPSHWRWQAVAMCPSPKGRWGRWCASA
jgi:hypothetical protein